MTFMKKIFFLTTFLFLSVVSFAQLIQASLGPGSTPNRVKIYLKAAATQTPVTISTLQFNLAISASIEPKPTMRIVSHAFGAAIWDTAMAAEAGFYHYSIFTLTSPLVINTTANVEFEAMEVEFCCGPNGTNTVSLVTLPDGGNIGSALFFLNSTTLKSNGSNLYYARAGVTVDNQFSYGVTAGTSTSTASLSNVALPLKWLSFSAVRQVNDALLSWTVDNDQDNERYVVERSTDGSNFIAFNETPKRQGSGSKKYSFVDKNITNLGSKTIYYRVKDVEVNNKFTYTDVKNIRLDMKGSISLFPNPAKDGFTLTIPYLNPDQQRVQLQLVNSLGQVIERKDITRLAATNYYYNVQSSLILSGEYLLKIYEDGELSETKRVLIKK